MSFFRVAETKRHLAAPNRSPLFLMGANYEGYFDRAWRLWDNAKFNPILIDRDFKKMAETGLNVVRLFVQPALEKEVQAGNFAKLDKVLQIAADYRLLVLLTFNDGHALNLARVAQSDAKIASRYRDDPIILGWDLENEPVFYNFVAAIYPATHPAPVQTSILVDHYGPRVSRQEALDLQAQWRIPSHLNPTLAYYYINALRLFIEFNNDATAWARQKKVTIVEYIYSTDSQKWHKLIEVLNGTVQAWLTVRRTPVRAVDPNHLITVGYNWLHFAALPANRVLDFQEFHKYGALSRSKFVQTTQTLSSLQKAFPQHPVLMGEFGYSNQTGPNPASSEPVEAPQTALFEMAILAFLRAHNFAGGLKWMLNDVDTTTNPYEASFGIYRVGNHPKPIQQLLASASQKWPAPPVEGSIKITQDQRGLAFRLTLDDKIMLAGSVFQDETFSWQAENIGYCFVDKLSQALQITAQGNGVLALDPWELAPTWDRTRQSILYRVGTDSLAQLATFPPDERASWSVLSGVTYRLEMGAPVEHPPAETPQIVPNPGEHVVLLGDANAMLRAALPYIRHFAPDVTFSPAQVAGRWPYVTVVATSQQVTDEEMQIIKATGARLVERIEGDVETVLQNMATQNRRFLQPETSPIPIDLPVEPPVPPESPTQPQLYVVQPGDTLSKIAFSFYGKSSLWHVIFAANQDVLDDPGRIRPGMKLKIPPIETNSN